MDPALFGQENRGSQAPDPGRETKRSWSCSGPFFRRASQSWRSAGGCQVVNVALGGTLLQDLPGEIRPFHGGGEEDRVHPVRSREGTLLHRLYGPIFPVNSAHHQAVDRLGEGTGDHRLGGERLSGGFDSHTAAGAGGPVPSGADVL